MAWYLVVVALMAVAGFIRHRKSAYFEKIEGMFPGPALLPAVQNGFVVYGWIGEVYSSVMKISWYFRRSWRIWLLNIPIFVLVTASDVEVC